MLSRLAEIGAPNRSFHLGSPARNSHRSGAAHFLLADGEDGSSDNRPYRLCSSLPDESLSPSSAGGNRCRLGLRIVLELYKSEQNDRWHATILKMLTLLSS